MRTDSRAWARAGRWLRARPRSCAALAVLLLAMLCAEERHAATALLPHPASPSRVTDLIADVSRLAKLLGQSLDLSVVWERSDGESWEFQVQYWWRAGWWPVGLVTHAHYTVRAHSSVTSTHTTCYLPFRLYCLTWRSEHRLSRQTGAESVRWSEELAWQCPWVARALCRDHGRALSRRTQAALEAHFANPTNYT